MKQKGRMHRECRVFDSEQLKVQDNRSYSLNSLKGGYMGDYIGDYYRGY